MTEATVAQGRVPFLGSRASTVRRGNSDTSPPIESLPGEFAKSEIFQLAASAFGVPYDNLAYALSGHDIAPVDHPWDPEASRRVVEALLKDFDVSQLGSLACALMASVAPIELEAILERVIRSATNMVVSRDVATDYLLEVLRAEGTSVCTDLITFELNAAATHDLIGSRIPSEALEEMRALLDDEGYMAYITEKYPLLKERLIIRLDLAASSVLTTLERISRHLPEIAYTFADGMENTQNHAWSVRSIKPTSGDSHNGANRVTLVHFSNGRTVVYKPRNVHGELRFQEYLAYLEELDCRLSFRKLAVLSCDGYGWVEFVESSNASSVGHIKEFYFRYGALIAALDAISGTDIHFENVVAAGSHPMIVDLETIFQPSEIESIDKGKNRALLSLDYYHDTPLITAMFDPAFLTGAINGSPLSRTIHSPAQEMTIKLEGERFVAVPSQINSHNSHIPLLNGCPLPFDDFVDDVVDGFRRVSRLIGAHRSKLVTGVLRKMFEGCRVRVIFRYTRHYAGMVKAVNSAYALQSVRNTEEILSRLWRTVSVSPGLMSVVAAEHFDVWNGDVPYFESEIGTRSTITSQGRGIPDVFPKSGWDVAMGRLLAKDRGRVARESDLLEFCLRAKVEDAMRSVAAVGNGEADTPEVPRDPVALLEAIQNRLLLSDGRILCMDILMGRNHRTSQTILGDDFYTGTTGICFALAYGDSASRAGSPSANLRALCDATLMSGHHESILETGICHGIGSAIYTAAHLSSLWGDSHMLALGEHLAEHAGRVLYADRHFDLFSGAAGLLRALLALRAVSPTHKIDTQIEAVVDHLIGHATRSGDAIAWMSSIPSAGPTTGYAHGVSGIADALLRAGIELDLKRAVTAAFGAERFVDRCRISGAGWRECESDASVAAHDMWCHGTSGIALFYQSLAAIRPEKRILETAQFALTEAERVARFENDSLCHGWLGNLEPLLNAEVEHGAAFRSPGVEVFLAGIGGRVARCGNERQHASMGLFTGYAGIAYQQLRCKAPAKYPSVLTFAPPVR